MRFLNNSNGGKEPSQSILEIGVENALKQTYFDKDSFDKRDGNYAKTKLPSNNTKSQCTRKDLEW